MPMLGSVEVKSWRGRFIHAAIITVLVIGGLSMVHPFVVMLSGSVRSELDEADVELMPSFWGNDELLYRKFLETKYNQDVTTLNRAHGKRYFSFKSPVVQDRESRGDGLSGVEALQKYLVPSELPYHWQVLGGIYGINTVPENLREMRTRLADHFDRDLDAASRDFGSPVSSWQAVSLGVPDWTNQRYDHVRNELFRVYRAMLREAPPANVRLVSLTGHFLESIVYPKYGQTRVNAYNDKHAIDIGDYSEFYLPARVPGIDQPQLRAEWIEYVTEELNPSFVVVDGVTKDAYGNFVSALAEAGHDTDGDKGAEQTLQLPDGRTWLSGRARESYEAFLATQSIEKFRLVGPEYEFGQAELPIAMAALEYDYVMNHTKALRWQYTWRNYINVVDELVFQGRALINTVIFCTMAIVLAMLVNPLAAYAMSRYKLGSTYKILLFLMATMAFPPMVTLIPQFILLRKLGLLNTHIGLVLPLIANGYMIFLLKGFFDSLPTELYEAARIDGASEMHMFFHITMALSKPILAVLALGTFTGAYTMFLYPLLVAPDPDMWLISVWLFQYQQRVSSSGVYASVVLASIPTLVIFLFAQRTIMRGIVVPTEK